MLYTYGPKRGYDEYIAQDGRLAGKLGVDPTRGYGGGRVFFTMQEARSHIRHVDTLSVYGVLTTKANTYYDHRYGIHRLVRSAYLVRLT